MLDRRGQQAESRSLFERAATIFRSLPERGGYGTRAAYAALAEHYRKLGRPDDEAYFRRLAR